MGAYGYLPRGRCVAVGCRAAILPSEILCPRHRVMAQSDTLTALGRLFRPGRPRQSATFSDLLERALAEILYFQTEGHRVPRDLPFMWDDNGGRS